MPVLTYGDLNRAIPALATLASERNYVSQKVAVKIARIRGVARRGWEPAEERINALHEELGQVGDVKCPQCRTALWSSERKRPMPNGPTWKAYKDAEAELLKEGAVEFPETLRLSELVRFATN